MPSMETSVAPKVCQLKVADCPFSTVSGLTEMEAVGAGGGGGGGGGGGAAFFFQAPHIITAPQATTSVKHFFRLWFTLSSLTTSNDFILELSQWIYFLLQFGLGILPGKSIWC